MRLLRASACIVPSVSPSRGFDVFAAFDDPFFSILINIATVEAAKAKGMHGCAPQLLSCFCVWPNPQIWTFFAVCPLFLMFSPFLPGSASSVCSHGFAQCVCACVRADTKIRESQH